MHCNTYVRTHFFRRSIAHAQPLRAYYTRAHVSLRASAHRTDRQSRLPAVHVRFLYTLTRRAAHLCRRNTSRRIERHEGPSSLRSVRTECPRHGNVRASRAFGARMRNTRITTRLGIPYSVMCDCDDFNSGFFFFFFLCVVRLRSFVYTSVSVHCRFS